MKKAILTSLPLLLVTLCPLRVRAQADLLVMKSPAGDYIGAGETHVTTDGNTFSLTGNAGYVAVATPFGYWIEFDAPGTEDLHIGDYTGALRYPFNGANPGITISGNGRGCNTEAGSFQILEIGFESNGTPNRLWAKFSHSCEGSMPPLSGEVRYHSLSAPPLQPRTIHVPSDYRSIQQAIDAASYAGDAVLVAPGTYAETINFNGKQIVVTSESSAQETIIAPPGNQNAVTFSASETNAILRGFTILGANYGVNISGASPVIESNIFDHCVYGIVSRYGSALIRGNLITRCGQNGLDMATEYYPVVVRNIIEKCGNGVALFGGTFVFQENTIRRNRGFGLDANGETTFDLLQNVIHGNGGSAVAWNTPAGTRGPVLLQNTIVGNTDSTAPAVSATGWDARGRIVNNVIVGTPALFLSPSGDIVPPTVEYNLFYSPNGPPLTGSNPQLTNIEHNITSNPLFLDATEGDWRLLAGSPAIDAAKSEERVMQDFSGILRPIDGDSVAGAMPDMGAYEYVPGPPRPGFPLFAISLETSTKLSWRPFDGATNFYVARSDSVRGPFAVFATTTNTTVADLNIVQGNVYYYAIAGENQLGVGAYSVPLQVKAGNRAPIAVADRLELLEDSQAQINPLANDSDPDNDPLTLEILTDTLPTGLTINSSNTLVYAPPLNYSGTNVLIYRAVDDRLRSSTNTITLVVLPVNDPPVVQNRAFNMKSDTNAVFALAIIDPDSTNHDVLFSTPPLHGVVQALPGARIFYQPAHGFVGSENFTFRVTDGETESADVSATIFVGALPDFDADGMPDAWETLWDLNNPAADPDQDTVDNRGEYLENTSPRNALSKLEIISVMPTLDHKVAITWKAVGGVRYRIYSSDGLPNASTFLPLIQSPEAEIETSSQIGQETIRSFIDTRPVVRNRFYRVSVIE